MTKKKAATRDGQRLSVDETGVSLERVVHADGAAVAGDAIVGGDVTAVAEIKREGFGQGVGSAGGQDQRGTLLGT